MQAVSPIDVYQIIYNGTVFDSDSRRWSNVSLTSDIRVSEKERTPTPTHTERIGYTRKSRSMREICTIKEKKRIEVHAHRPARRVFLQRRNERGESNDDEALQIYVSKKPRWSG